MHHTPDQIFEELRTLAAELALLEPDAPQRIPLEARREELRQEARAVSDAGRGSDDLQRELEHLRERIAELDAERVEVPAWQQTLTAGGRLSLIDPVADAARINEAIDRATAHDRAAIVARIAHLEEVLGR
ncbi:MAG: hypothetical protein QNJ89_01530 [Acidimicrobiia bacterium]|nr:hypothetical protein [Acidimicrobiia bacterium]